MLVETEKNDGINYGIKTDIYHSYVEILLLFFCFFCILLLFDISLILLTESWMISSPVTLLIKIY